jgi:Tfp pilus assembly ATPase PilU
LEQALINADSMNNLRLKIKLAGLQDDGADAPSDTETGKGDTARTANSFRLRR